MDMQLLRRTALDPSSPMPLYSQLRTKIRHWISTNEIKVGENVPTEEELCEQFGVSRNTVRKAIEGLVHEGLLERNRSKGTVVVNAGAALIERISGKSFTERYLQAEKNPYTKLIEFSIGECSELVRDKLDLAPGDLVVLVGRLRFVDNKPMAVDYSWLPYALFPQIAASDIESTGMAQSIFYLMESKYKQPISHWDETILSIPVANKEAQLLQIPVHTPCIQRLGAVYSIQGTLMAYQESVYTNHYSIEYTITRMGAVGDK